MGLLAFFGAAAFLGFFAADAGAEDAAGADEDVDGAAAAAGDFDLAALAFGLAAAFFFGAAAFFFGVLGLAADFGLADPLAFGLAKNIKRNMRLINLTDSSTNLF